MIGESDYYYYEKPASRKHDAVQCRARPIRQRWRLASLAMKEVAIFR